MSQGREPPSAIKPSSYWYRYPAQDHVGGDSKIPSILYYNREGELCAVGAEALQDSVIERAEEEEWVKLEWFSSCPFSTFTRTEPDVLQVEASSPSETFAIFPRQR